MADTTLADADQPSPDRTSVATPTAQPEVADWLAGIDLGDPLDDAASEDDYAEPEYDDDPGLFAQIMAETAEDDTAIQPLGEAPDRPQDSTAALVLQNQKPLLDKKIWTNPQVLAMHLGFASGKALEKWIMESEHVGTIMKEFNSYRRAHAEENRAQQVRFPVALDCYLVGETPARRRFSQPTAADKATWKALEYHAKLLFELDVKEIQMVTGIFHHMNWSLEKGRQLMWQLAQRLKKKHPADPATAATESKRTRAAKLKKMIENRDAKGRLTFKNLAKQQLRDRERANQSALRPPRRAGRDDDDADDDMFTSKASIGKALVAKDKAHLAHMEDPAVLKLVETLASDPDTLDTSTPEFQKLMRAWVETIDEDTIEEAIFTRHAPTASAFIPRKTLEEAHHFIKTTHRKFVQMDKAAKEKANEEGGTPEEISKAYSNFINKGARNTGVCRTLTALQQLGYILFGDDYSTFITYSRPDSNATAEEDEDVDGQTVAILSAAQDAMEMEEKGQVGGVDERQDNDTEAITRLMSNTKFERSHFLDACRELKLNPTTMLRLPTMRSNAINLYWFQVVAIAYSRRVVRDDIFRGAMITSLVGLGKTFMMGGIILAVSTII
jgi:hypothetical protein